MVTRQPLSRDSSENKQLTTAIPAQRQSLLLKQISQQVAHILGIKDLNQLDPELGFSELGIDSLGSVELRNKLQSSYDLKLSQTVIFDYPNITELTNHLSSLLFTDEVSKNNKQLESEDNLINLEALSEAEAETLLLEELNNLDFSLGDRNWEDSL